MAQKLEYTLDLNNQQFREKLKNAGVDVDKLENELKETGKTGKRSFSDIAGAVGNFAIGLNQGIELLKKVGDGISAVAGLVVDFDNNVSLLQSRFNATAEEAKNLTIQIQALSDTFGSDFNSIMKAGNALVNEFGITAEDAFNLIEQSAMKVPSEFNELLEQTREYSSQLSQMGISADQFLAITTQAFQKGVFNDKALDSIKEFNISLREATDTSKKAFEGIGLDVDTMRKELESGSKTIYDLLVETSNKASDLGINSKEFGTLLADVFRGAGEDAGKFILEIGKLETSLSNVKEESSDSQKAMLEFQKATNEVAQTFALLLLPLMKDFSSYLNDNKDDVKEYVSYLATLIEALGTVSKYTVGIIKSAAEEMAFSNNQDLFIQLYKSKQMLAEANAKLMLSNTQLAQNYDETYKSIFESMAKYTGTSPTTTTTSPSTSTTTTQAPALPVIPVNTEKEENEFRSLAEIYDETLTEMVAERERARDQILAIGENETEAFERNQEKQLTALNNAVAEGIITEQEYQNRVKQLKQDETDFYKQKEEEKTATSRSEWEKRLSDIQTAFNAISSAFAEAQSIDMQKIDEREEKELESIDKREKAGQLTREKAEKEREKVRKQAAKEREEEAKENKRFALVNAIINTAVAVTKVLATPWLAALVAAAGAVQVGLIASQAFKDGGYVDGNRHSAGGIKFRTRTEPDQIKEMEGGEYIMSRQTVQRVGKQNLDNINFGGGRNSSIITHTQTVVNELILDGQTIATIVNRANNNNTQSGFIITENT